MRSADRHFRRVHLVQSAFPKAELDPTFLAKAIDVASALEARWHDWVNREFDPVDKDAVSASLLTLSDRVPVISDYLKSDGSFASNKQSYEQNPLGFFDQSLAGSSLWWKQTSGTSGRPLDVLYENTFHFEQLFQTVRRVLYRVEAFKNRRERDLVSVVALHDNPQSIDCIWPDPTDNFRCICQLYFSESDEKQNRYTLEKFAKIRPETVTLKPSILERLVHLGLLGALHCSFILCSGSQLSRKLKTAVSQVSSARLIEAYGLTESAIFASECKMHAGMHVDGDVVAEVLDDNGQMSADGKGKLYITTSRNTAMPLLRYETGDIVEICAKPCECGRSTPRIMRVLGRVLKNFVLPSGREVSPSNFHTIFADFPLQEVQFVQKSPNHFLVLIQENEPTDDREYKKYICEVLGERVGITLEKTDFSNCANGKFQRYVRDF